MRNIAVVISAVLAMLVSAVTVSGQQPAPAAKPGYAPGLAEIMIFTQVRHTKLWLAGNAGNWDLADYEIDELKEGFEDVEKYHPDFKGVPVGKMVDTTIMPPVAEVEKAVKARDRTKFAAAFDKLTAACNACHQAANRSVIVIQRPASSPFPNQSFAPKRN